jgi:ABC-type Fe3+ transport system permease subunit
MKRLISRVVEALVLAFIAVIISIPVMSVMGYFYTKNYEGCKHLPDESIYRYYAATFLITFLSGLVIELSDENNLTIIGL